MLKESMVQQREREIMEQVQGLQRKGFRQGHRPKGKRKVKELCHGTHHREPGRYTASCDSIGRASLRGLEYHTWSSFYSKFLTEEVDASRSRVTQNGLTYDMVPRATPQRAQALASKLIRPNIQPMSSLTMVAQSPWAVGTQLNHIRIG